MTLVSRFWKYKVHVHIRGPGFLLAGGLKGEWDCRRLQFLAM